MEELRPADGCATSQKALSLTSRDYFPADTKLSINTIKSIIGVSIAQVCLRVFRTGKGSCLYNLQFCNATYQEGRL